MRCRWNHLLSTLLFLAVMVPLFPAQGQQPVVVTARLDTNVVSVGESTTLRVYAEIDPSLTESTDRIFSWYVDLLHTNNVVATANYDLLVRPESDNDPVLSSSGFTDGAHRRAIYDTFLNLPDAGRLQPVELFSVPVTGSADGQTTFRVQAGTEGPGLSNDFQVAPAGGGDPLTGADYSMAVATLTVGTVIEPPEAAISIERTAIPGQLLLTYSTEAGEDHWIEYRDSLGAGSWETLAGGPYNDGQLLVTASQSARFYRLRIGGVIGPPSPSISIERTGSPDELLLTYPVEAGFDHWIEFKDDLGSGTWQPLPGGPHNAGQLTVGTTHPHRFFRLRLGGDPGPPPPSMEASYTDLGGGQIQAEIQFAPQSGIDYVIEYQDELDPEAAWTRLPGAPHNSGSFMDPFVGAQRFYRIRVLH